MKCLCEIFRTLYFICGAKVESEPIKQDGHVHHVPYRTHGLQEENIYIPLYTQLITTWGWNSIKTYISAKTRTHTGVHVHVYT